MHTLSAGTDRQGGAVIGVFDRYRGQTAAWVEPLD